MKGRSPAKRVFRGTTLGPAQITQIEKLIDRHPRATREEIARETCRLFRWHRANGTLAVRSARDILVRLDEDNAIRLPAARGQQGRPHRHALELATQLIEPPLEVPEHGALSNGRLLLRPIVLEEQLGWRAYMERFHYLGEVAVVGESMRYIASIDGELIALLSWGAASFCNPPRDQALGWDEVTKKRNLHLVVNNVRFLLLPWIRQKHLASRILGANLRRLSRDWQATYGHPVLLAETFVDASRFRGTCYRASNWRYVGMTKGWSKSGYKYRFHGQSKSVWIYPLHREFLQRLRSSKPLHAPREMSMRFDPEKLPLEGAGGLFEVLATITDLRKPRGKRHKMQSLLTIAICGTLAGSKSITALVEWAQEQSTELLKRLGSRFGRAPSERTLRRFFKKIDVCEVDEKIGAWFAKRPSLLNQALAIDGKTVRGSGDGTKKPIHLLSAIVHGAGTVVAQVSVDAKTNEIPCVRPLLEKLDIQNAVVTADALLTQKEIARYITEEKMADYVFTVKGNQPTLAQNIADLRLVAFPPSAHHDG